MNRPVVYGAVAAARAGLAEPLMRLALPAGAGARRWGLWTERQYLATYSIWIALNLILIAGACVVAHRLVRFHFGALTADLSAALLLSSPIVLLSAREIHLGAFQIFVAVASLAFWHAALLGLPARSADGAEGLRPLSARGLAAASLGLGVLFLGKPCLEAFALGALLAAWTGRARKLPLILAGAAAPSLAWYLAVKAAGYPYAVGEVRDCGAGIWIWDVDSASGFFREAGLFAAAWGRALAEDMSLAQAPFAALGARALARTAKGRAFLALGGMMAAANAAFYFLVHRSHAVYAAPTLAFYSVPAAIGLGTAATWITKRIPRAVPAAFAAFALLLLIQAALAARQLPRYGG